MLFIMRALGPEPLLALSLRSFLLCDTVSAPVGTCIAGKAVHCNHEPHNIPSQCRPGLPDISTFVGYLPFSSYKGLVGNMLLVGDIPQWQIVLYHPYLTVTSSAGTVSLVLLVVSHQLLVIFMTSVDPRLNLRFSVDL